jgi:hypothetical protein
MAGFALRRRVAVLLLCAVRISPALGSEPDARTDAKAFFDAGNDLLARGDVAAALADFQRSRALFPTRGNTLNTAIALQRLGRFDEALEVYLTLPRDFTLDRDERQRVDREVELLRPLLGKLAIRAEAGAVISIDGRERGVAPLSEPLWVMAGVHSVRARQAGRADFERRVEIVTGAEQELVIELVAPAAAVPSSAPAPAAPSPNVLPPPPPMPTPAPSPPAHAVRRVIAVELGPALGFGFGGPLADSCTQGCKSSLPLGFSGRARGGFRLWPEAELGVELSYLRLRSHYGQRTDTLEPQGAGPQPGQSDDDLLWSAWSVGGYASWMSASRVHPRASLGVGVTLGRLSDERQGSYAVNPPVGEAYGVSAGTSQAAHATALYFEPELGVGVALTPRLELGLSLGLLGSLVLSPARFEREKTPIKNAAGEPELAYFRADELSARAFFALLPRLGASGSF